MSNEPFAVYPHVSTGGKPISVAVWIEGEWQFKLNVIHEDSEFMIWMWKGPNDAWLWDRYAGYDPEQGRRVLKDDTFIDKLIDAYGKYQLERALETEPCTLG